jgi:hypothetical protein
VKSSLVFYIIVYVFIKMGLKYAHIYTHQMKDLALHQIYTIASNRMSKNIGTGKRQPTIDVDCSLVIRSRGGTPCTRTNAQYLVAYASTLAKIGFAVMLVFDGNHRHHSKRATIQRRSDCQRSKIEMIVKKTELLTVTEDRKNTDSVEERNNLEKKQSDLKKQITSKCITTIVSKCW